MKIPTPITKGYGESMVRRLLGPEPCIVLDEELGCQPVAVRTKIRRLDPNDPTGQKTTPPEDAFVCRLYPATDDTQRLFLMAGVECAECIYFPDQDEDLELIMLRGFHSAALQAKQLLEKVRAGHYNRRAGRLILPPGTAG